jgi:drug/metabolite transporter (DMT)-like permease
MGSILLKMGSVEITYGNSMELLLHALSNTKILFGVALYVVPTFLWIYMLKRVDISFLQPLFSLVYVVTPVMAFMILHEKIPLNRWIGITVIVFGVLIIAKK